MAFGRAFYLRRTGGFVAGTGLAFILEWSPLFDDDLDDVWVLLVGIALIAASVAIVVASTRTRE